MRARMRDMRKIVGAAGLALGFFLTTASGASALSSVPYFDGPGGFGFVNDEMEPIDWLIPDEAELITIGSTNPEYEIQLVASEIVNDTPGFIDRTVTWTIINTTAQPLEDVLIFFTALGTDGGTLPISNVTLYSDEPDWSVMEYSIYTFAGFELNDLNTAMQRGSTFATRTFRFTADVDGDIDRPASLGVSAAEQFEPAPPIPEPSTALLLGLGLVGLSRRRARWRA